MNIYNGLLDAIKTEYDVFRLIKESERGSVTVVRHRISGKRYLFRRFMGEGDVYKKLLGIHCPNLPQIYEVGESNGETVVLEEYIQGDTLAFILEGGLLTYSETRNIAKQICQALWVLHSMGMVHRDIKPENVIICGDEVVLIDFDASRIVKQNNAGDTQILGTVGYAAPEQFGITQSDGRADIYALGVLLNIMLTGKHPSEVLAAGKIGRVVQKCTMTNPSKRYKNVLYLMEAL